MRKILAIWQLSQEAHATHSARLAASDSSCWKRRIGNAKNPGDQKKIHRDMRPLDKHWEPEPLWPRNLPPGQVLGGVLGGYIQRRNGLRIDPPFLPNRDFFPPRCLLCGQPWEDVQPSRLDAVTFVLELHIHPGGTWLAGGAAITLSGPHRPLATKRYLRAPASSSLSVSPSQHYTRTR